MSTESNKSVDVTRFVEDIKGAAQSHSYDKAKTVHPEAVTEELKINFIDRNKNMTTTRENHMVTDNGNYINNDEIVTDQDSCVTNEVLSEDLKKKTLPEHIVHSDEEETKDKKKEKKLLFFTFSKNKTKYKGKAQKNKQSACEKIKEEAMIVQEGLSVKDSSKSKETESSVGRERLLVSKTNTEDGKIETIPPPAMFADSNMRDDSLNSEAIKSELVHTDSVSNTNVSFNENSDDTSKVHEISGVVKHDETVCSGVPSNDDPVNGSVDPSNKPSFSQSEKENLKKNGTGFFFQNKANTTVKKKRWSFNFGDSRKKAESVDGGITDTNDKESEKKHEKFRRLGIRALSQPKINDEDKGTSSLPEDEKKHKKALQKSLLTMKTLKMKDQKKKEELKRRKSATDVRIEYDERRSSLTTVEESWETDRRRRSLVFDEELRIEESDAFEGVSLSSLDEEDPNQKKESLELIQETVNLMEIAEKNVSSREEPATEDTFSNVIAQQILEAVMEAVKTQTEHSETPPKEPVITKISAQQSIDCLKDTLFPLAAAQQSFKCTNDWVISTGTAQKPVESAIVQQTSKSPNDAIVATTTGLQSVGAENDDVVNMEKTEEPIESEKRVLICTSTTIKSIEFGNDAVIATVTAHQSVEYDNDAVIHSSKADNYLACVRDTVIPTDTGGQSSDLEREAVPVKLGAKQSLPLTEKTVPPEFINPQSLSVKATDSVTDQVSRKGDKSCVAPVDLIRINKCNILLSSGQLNTSEGNKSTIAHGISIPCLPELIQTVLERRDSIPSEHEKKPHSKITEDDKIYLTSASNTVSLQVKPMSSSKNVPHEKENYKGKVTNRDFNLKNQIPSKIGGNESLFSDEVLSIASVRWSEMEDTQDIIPIAEDELSYEVKRSNVFSLPITNDKSSRQGKVQIFKDVGVQVPDVYRPLDDVFGFRSVPAENVRHVGLQFPETETTWKETDQRKSSNKRVKSFYI